jgi:hypothetical protein
LSGCARRLNGVRQVFIGAILVIAGIAAFIASGWGVRASQADRRATRSKRTVG